MSLVLALGLGLELALGLGLGRESCVFTFHSTSNWVKPDRTGSNQGGPIATESELRTYQCTSYVAGVACSKRQAC